MSRCRGLLREGPPPPPFLLRKPIPFSRCRSHSCSSSSAFAPCRASRTAPFLLPFLESSVPKRQPSRTTIGPVFLLLPDSPPPSHDRQSGGTKSRCNSVRLVVS
ncbi:hypothetical protein OPV22_019032 [Ensete ventricosum]|uniref:Uncharacterized protein n=1 Tax=Ensete ventricosum TaxID=4639 RepID=A0AAV8R1L5_ENSVE|nr:hypothetical protein OPV22_019032 [Ensete ventricosum]